MGKYFSMIIVDIVKTDQYDNLWHSCLDFVKSHCTEDPLYNNYTNLDKKDFVSLPVVIENSKIIAFSGMQVNDVWGPNIARVSSRFWLHPLKRHPASKFNTSTTPWFNSEFLIKVQLEELKLQNIPHAFISREGRYRKSFSNFIALVNSYNKTNFRLLEDLYLINNVPQMIAVHSQQGDHLEEYLYQETMIRKL